MNRSIPTLIVVVLLTAAGIVVAIGGSNAGVAGAATVSFSITTNPPIDPSFDPTVSDYAIRCSGSPTTQVSTTGSGPVTIGGAVFSGPAKVEVPLGVGQQLQVTEGGATVLHPVPAQGLSELFQLENWSPATGERLSADSGPLFGHIRHERCSGLVGYRSVVAVGT